MLADYCRKCEWFYEELAECWYFECHPDEKIKWHFDPCENYSEQRDFERHNDLT